MSRGKDAARDTRYGRRGGRWATGDRVDVALAAIDRMRRRGQEDGTWPDGTPKGDRDCRDCKAPVAHHGPPCVFCGRPPEHHQDGDLEAERDGRRRMARARQLAGQPLDDVDREVLAESIEPEPAA